MVSGIPPVGIIQNERFLSCDTVLLGVRFVKSLLHAVLETHAFDRIYTFSYDRLREYYRTPPRLCRSNALC